MPISIYLPITLFEATFMPAMSANKLTVSQMNSIISISLLWQTLLLPPVRLLFILHFPKHYSPIWQISTSLSMVCPFTSLNAYISLRFLSIVNYPLLSILNLIAPSLASLVAQSVKNLPAVQEIQV